jgi:hypothetical protein
MSGGLGVRALGWGPLSPARRHFHGCLTFMQDCQSALPSTIPRSRHQLALIRLARISAHGFGGVQLTSMVASRIASTDTSIFLWVIFAPSPCQDGVLISITSAARSAAVLLLFRQCSFQELSLLEIAATSGTISTGP